MLKKAAGQASKRVSRKKKNSTITNSSASTVSIIPINGGVDDSDISDIAAEELLTEITQQKNVMDNEDIDPNICCMCFQSWHDDVLEGGGAEWIFFKCGRWLHEDCIEDVVSDNDGFQHFCSFCIDKYTV